jgi:16S rRNA (guanine(966)-N(2))-methyltransferase RsmD
MRIISGTLGGRNFNSPGGNRTHPMSDKVRGALFNILGDIGGLSVLDPFAGTGAVSFEAISRGAVSAVMVECDKKAQRTLEENIELLNVSSQVELFKGYAKAWSNRNQSRYFDIIVCDPPYDDLDFLILDKIARHLKTDGIYVLSWPGKYEIPKIHGTTQMSSKSYGDAQLGFFKSV